MRQELRVGGDLWCGRAPSTASICQTLTSVCSRQLRPCSATCVVGGLCLGRALGTETGTPGLHSCLIARQLWRRAAADGLSFESTGRGSSCWVCWVKGAVACLSWQYGVCPGLLTADSVRNGCGQQYLTRKYQLLGAGACHKPCTLVLCTAPHAPCTCAGRGTSWELLDASLCGSPLGHLLCTHRCLPVGMDRPLAVCACMCELHGLDCLPHTHPSLQCTQCCCL